MCFQNTGLLKTAVRSVQKPETFENCGRNASNAGPRFAAKRARVRQIHPAGTSLRNGANATVAGRGFGDRNRWLNGSWVRPWYSGLLPRNASSSWLRERYGRAGWTGAWGQTQKPAVPCQVRVQEFIYFVARRARRARQLELSIRSHCQLGFILRRAKAVPPEPSNDGNTGFSCMNCGALP